VEFPGGAFWNTTLRPDQRWQASSRSSSWCERNPRTVTLFEVSNGTGWWSPAYRRLSDRRHRHGAQQPAPQARPCLPFAEARIYRPKRAKIGRAGLKVLASATRAPPSQGAMYMRLCNLISIFWAIWRTINRAVVEIERKKKDPHKLVIQSLPSNPLKNSKLKLFFAHPCYLQMLLTQYFL
jgi:hypothetical protein